MAARLTRHGGENGFRWAYEGKLLTSDFSLSAALDLSRDEFRRHIESSRTEETADAPLLAPIEPTQEAWAAGVTYLRSREAREAESDVADVYERVYAAERPELFFKAAGFRVVGPAQPIRVRADSRWNVPEPELTLVANSRGQIVGYTVGDDVSSRDIEGENPLYLPQAKVFDGSCALGPAIVLCDEADVLDLEVSLSIRRGAETVFTGQTRTSQMKRTPNELVSFLMRELSFPSGAFLMTGTGIVPADDFSLQSEDVVSIRVGELTLDNTVA